MANSKDDKPLDEMTFEEEVQYYLDHPEVLFDGWSIRTLLFAYEVARDNDVRFRALVRDELERRGVEVE